MTIYLGDGPEGQPDALSLDDLVDEETPIDAAGEDGNEEESEEEDEEGAEEEEEGEDEPEKRAHVVKRNGKEVTLELDAEEENRLIQMGHDYTEKTMELAEDRKEFESDRGKLTEIRQQHENAMQETVSRLQAWTQWMEGEIGQAPDYSLLQEDQTAYFMQKELHEARKGKLSQAYQAVQHMQQELAASREQRMVHEANETDRVLKGTLPGWSEALMTELATYAEGLGLNPQNADRAMLNPGFWQLLHKAKAFDAVDAQKKKLKPVAHLQKVVKPTAGATTSKQIERKKRESAFDRNPSVDNLIGIFG